MRHPLHKLSFYSASAKNTIAPLLALLLTTLALSAGCHANPLKSEKERQAQNKLDNLLGKNQQEEQPEQLPAPQAPETTEADPFQGFPGWAKNMVPGQPDIQIQETKADYQISVKLANPKDANSVKVSVTPHRIEVSGQSSFGKDGFQGSSSFFKSLSTDSELKTNQLKRSQPNEGLLIFSVPKTVASEPKQPQNQARQIQPSQQRQPASKGNTPSLSPDVLEQLDSTPGREI